MAGVVDGQAVNQAVTNAAFLSSTSGTEGFPLLITAAGGIPFVAAAERNQRFIAGNGAPVVISANPQIAVGLVLCQRLTLIGQDDANTVELHDGDGLTLNGNAVLSLNRILELMWTGSVWLETFRNF